MKLEIARWNLENVFVQMGLYVFDNVRPMGPRIEPESNTDSAGPEPGSTYDGRSGDWSGTFPCVVYLYQVNGMGVLKMSGFGDAVR